MKHARAQKCSLVSSGRKWSNAASFSTSNNKEPQKEKSTPSRASRYETFLNTKGVYMGPSELGIADTSKRLCQDLLESPRVIHQGSVFDDAFFENTCNNIRNANKARATQYVSRLMVPSAEMLAHHNADLTILKESVGEEWDNAIPITGTRPKPGYSVGFQRKAFTGEQHSRLSQCIGNLVSGDQSVFMATRSMYFPFLACDKECGAAALDVADGQNTHAMALAARGIVELFRLVKREDEVNRQILSFSVSHNKDSVRIYGYYPVIDGEQTEYYRHPIHRFSLTALNGKERWTAYRFTTNVYELWVPEHIKFICSAIDQLNLPSRRLLQQPPRRRSAKRSARTSGLKPTGLQQGLASHNSTPPEADSISLRDEHACLPCLDLTITIQNQRRRGNMAPKKRDNIDNALLGEGTAPPSLLDGLQLNIRLVHSPMAAAEAHHY